MFAVQMWYNCFYGKQKGICIVENENPWKAAILGSVMSHSPYWICINRISNCMRFILTFFFIDIDTSVKINCYSLQWNRRFYCALKIYRELIKYSKWPPSLAYKCSDFLIAITFLFYIWFWLNLHQNACSGIVLYFMYIFYEYFVPH